MKTENTEIAQIAIASPAEGAEATKLLEIMSLLEMSANVLKLDLGLWTTHVQLLVCSSYMWTFLKYVSNTFVETSAVKFISMDYNKDYEKYCNYTTDEDRRSVTLV